MPFDLKAKVGPLPLWGWGAVVAGGAFVLIKSGGGGASGGKSGGQKLPTYNTDSTLTQNIGDAYPVNQFGYGPSDSYISDSFFGSPLSLWTAGPMDYTGLFRDHRGRDRQHWDTHGGGRRRHHGRDSRGDGGAFDNRGGSDNGFGQDSPAGAGGFGYHHSKGPRFPSAPPGGEGFDNGGQSFVGGSGGGRAQNGGNPYAQQTQMGTQGQQYLVQKGDTLNGIASKLWGPGSDGSSIQSANSSVLGQNSNGKLPQGVLLTIPGAPQSGPPAPGGPAGNGIGGGSVSANGSNYGVGAAYGDHKGAGTSSAGASGGGSPTEGQSGGNSSRAKQGNASRSYAVSQQGGKDSSPSKGNRSRYK